MFERIEQRLQELGLTERAASIKAVGNPDLIRNLKRNRSRSPRAENLVKLAQVLEVSESWLLGSDGKVPETSVAQPHGGMSESDATLLPHDHHVDGRELTPDQHIWQVGPHFATLPGYAPGDRFLLDMSVSPRGGDDVLANVSDAHGRTETVLRRYSSGWLIGSMCQPIWVDNVRTRIMGVIVRRWWSRDDD